MELPKRVKDISIKKRLPVLPNEIKIAKLPQHHSFEYKGLNIVVEWPKGSIRDGKDEHGNPWRREQKADYGYIDDTSAAGDKEPLDIYIGDEDRKSNRVYVLEQLTEDGSFDEYKMVTGVPSLEAAQKLYLDHYPKGWGDTRLGDAFETDLDHLRGAVEEHQEKEGEGKAVADPKTSSEIGRIRKSSGEKAGTSMYSEKQLSLLKDRGFDQQANGTYLCYHCSGIFRSTKSALAHEMQVPYVEDIRDAAYWWESLKLYWAKQMGWSPSPRWKGDTEFMPTWESGQIGFLEKHPDQERRILDQMRSAGRMNVDKEKSDFLRDFDTWRKRNQKTGAEENKSDKDKVGTKLTGFSHDGPATCMHCTHRTPHSKNAQGEEVDSCSHPVVMRDPELSDKKLPDGTIEVDYDDWCIFARAPQGEEGDKVTKNARMRLAEAEITPPPPKDISTLAPESKEKEKPVIPPVGLGFDMVSSLYQEALNLMK